MDKSRLTNLWLTKVEPLSEAPFKQLGKFQELKDCQIVDKRIPDTVFEQLAKLRKLEMLYLSGEAEIEPKCFNRLERIRGLRGFGVGKSLLSSSQLKIVLQNQKKPPVLTLAGREHLIDDLEVARLAGITYLSIRDAIITSEIVEKLKQLKLNYLLIDLQGTSTSNSIIQELKKSIPGVNFNYSEYEMPT